MNRTRIFSFKDKPPISVEPIPRCMFSPPRDLSKRVQPQRFIPQSAERTLDAPDIIDDFYLNLLDWGSSNVLAIALGNTVYLWNGSDGETTELVTVNEEDGPITSVSWAVDGQQIAVGLNNSHVQIWDCVSSRQHRTLRGGHRARVGALTWNNHVLTTGGGDGRIINNDVRVRSLLEFTITQWLHRLEDHNAAVRALAWCPFQGNLLASGGGGADQYIKFWNTSTGMCLNSVNTGSQVCALQWNKNEQELLSSHGFNQKQLILWKYPYMKKMAELSGHTSRVLFMDQSPDGRTVASAAGDEILQLWNVFGTPEAAGKRPDKGSPEPFSNLNRIR